VSPREFKRWRQKNMKITQAKAARLLGLHRNTIYSYECGMIPIDKRTRLAMAALSLGLRDYEI